MTQSATPSASAAPGPGRAYPIVEMRDLRRPERGGPFKIGPRTRHDVPRPREGHFVLVYKVGNRYVVDNMHLGPRDDKVINASQVSTVDLGAQTPVQVEVTVASQDHSMFTVVVTFACTVEDPVAVVRGGITDPGAILLTYLRKHHGFSQMGLGFPIAEVNEARRYIGAQLTAYATVDEPYIGGMTVTMASVEVRTPREEFAKAAQQRQMRDWHEIENERVDLDVDLRSHKQAKEHGIRKSEQDQAHQLRMSAQADGQDLDHDKRRYRRLSEDEEQLHEIETRKLARAAEDVERRHAIEARREELEAELTRMGMSENYRLTALRANAELLDDPMRALQLSYLSGHINAAELADRMQALRTSKHELDQRAVERKHELERAQKRDEAELRKEEIAFDRERTRAELEARRAEAAQKAEADRLEREHQRQRGNLEMLWHRQDDLLARRTHDEREQAIFKAKVEMGRSIVERGLLDTTSQNLEDILRLDNNGLPELGKEKPVPLPSQQGSPVENDGPHDDSPREKNE